MKQGQTALEFIVLLGFMLFVFTAFFYAMQERSTIIAAQGRHAELRSVADILEQEISTAARVKNGYARTFELPHTLNVGNYSISLISSSEIIIGTVDEEYIVFLPVNVSTDTGSGPAAAGRIYPGRISITKFNNAIVLRSRQ